MSTHRRHFGMPRPAKRLEPWEYPLPELVGTWEEVAQAGGIRTDLLDLLYYEPTKAAKVRAITSARWFVNHRHLDTDHLVWPDQAEALAAGGTAR